MHAIPRHLLGGDDAPTDVARRVLTGVAAGMVVTAPPTPALRAKASVGGDASAGLYFLYQFHHCPVGGNGGTHMGRER
jgi:hypothetical protein